MNELSDEEIVASLRDPHRRDAALEQLWKRWYGAVRGLLEKETSDRELVAEVIPRVFLSTYDYWSQAREPCHSFKAWLFKVAKNKLRDALDAQDKEWEQVDSFDDEHVDEPAGPGCFSAVAEGCSSRWDAAVGEVMAQLKEADPKVHLILDLAHQAQCSRKEIYEATGLTSRTFGAYLKRAQEKFVRLARQHPVLSRLTADEEEPGRRTAYVGGEHGEQ